MKTMTDEELVDFVTSNDIGLSMWAWHKSELLSSLVRGRKAIALLKELHAMVWGECAWLLDEDRGGTARLDVEINALLKEATDEHK